jgi:hypothetical protein
VSGVVDLANADFIEGDAMVNQAMQRKITSGEAVDIGTCPTEGAYYLLEKFEDDKDYFDSVREAWIWSIGRRRSDGKIIASRSSDLYQNDEYECLFLR